uniref:Secreted protein n=1 Tax=Rhinopithecus roxellana TaxID=61622 RepID=A0A2K6PUD5_RHIRO
MKVLPHSLHSWSFFPVGISLWVTTISGDHLSVCALGFLCCSCKVPSEVASNVEVSVARFSEDTCDSTSVMGGCGNDPLSLGSGPSSVTTDRKCKYTCSGCMKK